MKQAEESCQEVYQELAFGFLSDLFRWSIRYWAFRVLTTTEPKKWHRDGKKKIGQRAGLSRIIKWGFVVYYGFEPQKSKALCSFLNLSEKHTEFFDPVLYSNSVWDQTLTKCNTSFRWNQNIWNSSERITTHEHCTLFFSGSKPKSIETCNSLPLLICLCGLSELHEITGFFFFHSLNAKAEIQFHAKSRNWNIKCLEQYMLNPARCWLVWGQGISSLCLWRSLMWQKEISTSAGLNCFHCSNWGVQGLLSLALWKEMLDWSFMPETTFREHVEN